LTLSVVCLETVGMAASLVVRVVVCTMAEAGGRCYRVFT